MSKTSIKTAVFYWLATVYLSKMHLSTSLDECKRYFKQAINKAADNCSGGLSESMYTILYKVDTMDSRERLIQYASNMVAKNCDKLRRAGVNI